MSSGGSDRVADEDWSLDDLSGRVHAGVEFIRVDMAESTSDGGLAFENCTFRQVAFDLAEHTSAAFVNCVFVGCRFVGTVLRDCKLVGSSFERCDLGRTTVTGGDWSFAMLRAADLRTARFSDVRMRECDLRGIDARGGFLRSCRTEAAQWHNAVLDRCDLRGSDLESIDPANVSLAGARITWEQAVVLAAAFGLDVVPD
ncbi:pentapeptide repeat-containing protein [uncultured Jatrophihabitans sp.]|uniref:pentapeptide repeat-containing protein n=1 Tax=uncultured Jatrophihabitans sp. TaxID=1610747 RepID=UPI0035C95F81